MFNSEFIPYFETEIMSLFYLKCDNVSSASNSKTDVVLYLYLYLYADKHKFE